MKTIPNTIIVFIKDDEVSKIRGDYLAFGIELATSPEEVESILLENDFSKDEDIPIKAFPNQRRQVYRKETGIRYYPLLRRRR